MPEAKQNKVIFKKYFIRPNDLKMSIAVCGSRTYENKQKIREMIFMLKQRFGSKLEIVSGGNTEGAEKYVKKYSLEMGIDYKEFNPAYTNKNLYSAMPDDYYGKQYHSTQLFHRNELLIQYCDSIVVFETNDLSAYSKNLILLCKRRDKGIVIINEKS